MNAPSCAHALTLHQDFQTGDILKEKVIPSAVLYFTGNSCDAFPSLQRRKRNCSHRRSFSLLGEALDEGEEEDYGEGAEEDHDDGMIDFVCCLLTPSASFLYLITLDSSDCVPYMVT